MPKSFSEKYDGKLSFSTILSNRFNDLKDEIKVQLPCKVHSVDYINNQVDLEKDLNLKNPTVTGLISRLEKKGYMKREKSSKGPNYKSVLITDEGIRIIEEGKRITDNVEKEMFSVLDKDEKKELTRLLQKVIDSRNLKN